MKKIKAIWLTISGSISSIIPLFFTVCKTGACGAVCVSPIASVLGISSASLISSPLMQPLYSLLLVISAVSFTVSYYKLYVLPKFLPQNSCATSCDCADTKAKSRQQLFSIWTFWIGITLSTLFFTYYEVQNYKSSVTTEKIKKTTIDTIDFSGDENGACCSESTNCE